MAKSVLVIDDNPQNNSQYIDPLRKLYNVDVTMALSSAERMIKKKKYDLMVIDIMMPIQNLNITNELQTGLEFYRLKIEPYYPDKKILFWSILARDSFVKFFQNNSRKNLAFLGKDFDDKEHLFKKVKQMLGDSYEAI